MKRVLSLALASFVALAFVGCSSSSESTSSTTTADAGTTKTDSGTSTTTDAGSSSGATGNCGSIVTCAGSCQDQACLDTCKSAGSAAGQSQFDTLYACLSSKCQSAQTDAEYQQCAQTNCSTEISGCQGLGGGSTGTPTDGGTVSTCLGINQCMQSCASGDQACLQACYNAGSTAAKSAYQALVSCAQTNNCTDPATQQQCLQTHCNTQLQTCMSN